MKRNYNELLIWSAAIVTVVRYAAAFIASDMGEITGVLSSVVTIFLGLSGLGMGVLDVIGGAALFQGWRKIMPQAGKPWPFRFKVLSFFVFGLILNGIIIIVPFTVSRVMQETMKVALGGGWWVWFWAAAVNIAPYMLIGGVSVSSNLVATESEYSPEKAGRTSGKKAEYSAEKSENSGALRWPAARMLMSAEDVRWLATAPSGEICAKFHLPADGRLARDWRKKAAKELQEVTK